MTGLPNQEVPAVRLAVQGPCHTSTHGATTTSADITSRSNAQ